MFFIIIIISIIIIKIQNVQRDQDIYYFDDWTTNFIEKFFFPSTFLKPNWMSTIVVLLSHFCMENFHQILNFLKRINEYLTCHSFHFVIHNQFLNLSH